MKSYFKLFSSSDYRFFFLYYKIFNKYNIAYLDKFKLIKFTYFKVKQIFNGLVYISVIVNLVSSFCAKNKRYNYKTVRYNYLFIILSTLDVPMLRQV